MSANGFGLLGHCLCCGGIAPQHMRDCPLTIARQSSVAATAEASVLESPPVDGGLGSFKQSRVAMPFGVHPDFHEVSN